MVRYWYRVYRNNISGRGHKRRSRNEESHSYNPVTRPDKLTEENLGKVPSKSMLSWVFSHIQQGGHIYITGINQKVIRVSTNPEYQTSRYEFGTGLRPLCSRLGGRPGPLGEWGEGAEENGGGEVGIVGDMPRYGGLGCET